MYECYLSDSKLFVQKIWGTDIFSKIGPDVQATLREGEIQ